MRVVNDKIDIVLPWVDGSDLTWIAEKEKWKSQVNADYKANSQARYESWDNLIYWFRAIETNLPWVNKIFLLTYGHIPSFLNLEHPKLVIVKHEDFIPKEFLPTFKSRTIELNMHRIEGLSDNFILFNDDMFPLSEIKEQYYFKNNVVCDEAIEGHIVPVNTSEVSSNAKYVQINNMMVINKHFNKREVQKKNFFKWFNLSYGRLLKRNINMHYWYDFEAFRDPHMPSAMKKKTLELLWNEEYELMSNTCKNKFRCYTDISRFLIRYWNICEGSFYPRITQGKSFVVTIKNYKNISNIIRARKYPMVCLNENCSCEEFEIIKKEINAALAELFTKKSSFEL